MRIISSLIAIGLIFVSLWLVAFLGLNHLGEKIIFKYANESFVTNDIEVIRPRFNRIYPSSFNEITIQKFTSYSKILGKGRFGIHSGVHISIDKLKISFNWFNPRKVQLKIQDASLVVGLEEAYSHQGESQFEHSLYIHSFEIPIAFQSYAMHDLEESLKKALKELTVLYYQGVTHQAFDIQGTFYVSVDDEMVEMNLFTRKKGEFYSLTTHRDTLKKLSLLIDIALTDEEINVMAQYPLRAAKLLKIKQHVARSAKFIKKSYDGSVIDAYQHILLSYLITKEYGEFFSKLITDAHEVNSVTPNTPEDHIMDYHNNAIGRKYALEGIEETEIIEVMLRDENVILSTSEVYQGRV